MYDACVRAGIDSDQYWRMSPQESYRWLKAKTPPLKIGGLGEQDIKEMAKNIREDTEGRYA